MIIKQTIVECAALLALASAAALAVNSARHKGLTLGRNYFPKTPSAGILPDAADPPVDDRPPQTPALPENAARPPEHEFQSLTLAEAQQYHDLHDPAILFVDARNDKQYKQGHIPRAIQFFHYYPERYADNLLLYTDLADMIIVYCTGGDCEDSIQAARYLVTDLDPPLDINKVYIFEGGMEEWCAAGCPLEPPEGKCDHE